jgi:hypothetical protein
MSNENTTKILVLDIDGYHNKFEEFCRNVAEQLSVHTIQVDNPEIEIEHNYLFKKFSNAGFSLENFLLHNNFYSDIRDYEHVLISWGNYSVENIEKIKPFLHDTWNKKLILFSHNNILHSQSWVFGNISAVVKWLSGLFKLSEEMFDSPGNRDGYMMEGDRFNIAIWFAIRIGLTVYGFDKK